jgi:hypothetical protein
MLVVSRPQKGLSLEQSIFDLCKECGNVSLSLSW